MEVQLFTGFPGSASGKELACQCRRCKRHRFDPWVGKILWRREWQPTSVFLFGEFHGQRSLEGYSPWGCKELDVTKVTWHAHTVIYNVVFTFCQMVKWLSHTCTHTCLYKYKYEYKYIFFLAFFFIMVYHRTLVFIHAIYNSSLLLIPCSQSVPPPCPSFLGTSLLSIYVSLLLFHRYVWIIF